MTEIDLGNLPSIDPDPRSFYEKWQESEGIDVIKGIFVEDMRALPVKPWKRKGGLGVFINLEGAAEENDAYICEIPPGGSLLPQKHLFEETIFILEGRGSTTFWNEGGSKDSLEWQSGSLFSPPLNAWHQHFNVSGDKPARYIGVTLAPENMNIFHNTEFIFNNPFVFKDRYGGQEDYFSGKGNLFKAHDIKIKVWETNFIADVQKIDMHTWKERGAGGKSLFFELSDNCMGSHISRFPVGTYKKAHRHHAGAHVMILSGEGYTLMWEEGKPIGRYDWKVGSLIVPPEMRWHQHFNTRNEPATYCAIHGKLSKKHRGSKQWKLDLDYKKGGAQIEYEDQDPKIWEMFNEELTIKGVKNKMPKLK